MEQIKQEIAMYTNTNWFHYAGKLMSFKAWWPDRHLEL